MKASLAELQGTLQHGLDEAARRWERLARCVHTTGAVECSLLEHTCSSLIGVLLSRHPRLLVRRVAWRPEDRVCARHLDTGWHMRRWQCACHASMHVMNVELESRGGSVVKLGQPSAGASLVRRAAGRRVGVRAAALATPPPGSIQRSHPPLRPDGPLSPHHGPHCATPPRAHPTQSHVRFDRNMRGTVGCCPHYCALPDVCGMMGLGLGGCLGEDKDPGPHPILALRDVAVTQAPRSLRLITQHPRPVHSFCLLGASLPWPPRRRT